MRWHRYPVDNTGNTIGHTREQIVTSNTNRHAGRRAKQDMRKYAVTRTWTTDGYTTQ
jgi:hypothetical protein